jgi:hypothetical protein
MTESRLFDTYKILLVSVKAFINIGLKTMQAWTIKDDKVYTITYVAEEEDFQNDFPIAQKMIESFEINR